MKSDEHLYFEDGAKFKRLPVARQIAALEKMCDRGRRAIRHYMRRLWRNDVIYCSAQPVNNIPLCRGHIGMYERELAVLKGEVFGFMDEVRIERRWCDDYGELRAERDRRLRKMVKRGGLLKAAALHVMELARVGKLAGKGCGSAPADAAEVSDDDVDGTNE